MNLQITKTCLVCDTNVSVSKAGWDSCTLPAAACVRCAGDILTNRVPWHFVKMLYLLRCQVSALSSRLSVLEKDMGRMMTAQQEMEQEIVRPSLRA